MGNQNYDGLPHAGHEDRRPKYDPLADKVDFICDQLERAARGEHVAWTTSNAVCGLRNGSNRKETPHISSEQRDRMLWGLAIARSAILACFENRLEFRFAREGLDALVVLIVLWSETPEARDERPPELRSDMNDRARRFNNCCHNAVLTEQIEDRAASRLGVNIRAVLGSVAYGD
jgi:hypothetical protein